MTAHENERLQPPPNSHNHNSYYSKLHFLVRVSADLQVASVLKSIKPWLASLSGSVLEVGCGDQPYRHLISKSCSNYTGLDWEHATEHFSYKAPDTIYYSGEVFPFPDDTFNHLFHTEVLEHIYNANQFLQECARVVMPGGRILFTVPFQARYHYKPFDYFRYTPAALGKMLENAGYRDINISPRGNDITVAAYKCVTLVYRWLFGSFGEKLLGVCFFPLAIIGLLVGHASLFFNVGSTDDCLGYTVEATV